MTSIGHVLRASTEGFTCGTRSAELRYPAFGAFVQTKAIDIRDDAFVVGVITAIRVDDDPLVRQLIMASDMNPSAILDQRENRMVPVEIDVLNIGYIQQGNRVYHSLPPRPPMSLDEVYLCTAEEVRFFLSVRAEAGFLRLILNASGIPNSTELLGAVIRNAAEVIPPDERYGFLVGIGQQLAKLMGHDPQGLHHLLSMIRPA